MNSPAISRVLTSVSGLLFVSLLGAQVHIQGGPGGPSVEKLHELWRNTGRLLGTLQLDRQVYFPAEDATLKITITNPTSQTMEVYDALHIQNGQISLYRRDPLRKNPYGAEWLPLNPSGHNSGGPTIFIQPGQPLEKEFVFSDPATRSPRDAQGKLKADICGECRIPEQEGEYRFLFRGGAQADFRVVWPSLEQWTEVTFQRPYQFQVTNPDGKQVGGPRTTPRRVGVMVLGYQGSHVVAVTVDAAMSDPRADIDPNGRFTGYLSRLFGVHRRLVTSAKAITSLQATADAGENITIIYTDQDGQHRIKLNPQRDVVP